MTIFHQSMRLRARDATAHTCARMLGALALTLSVFAAVSPASVAKAEDSLVIASFGGAYGESQKKAFFEPFTEKTGIEIIMTSYSGGLGELRAQNETGSAKWDVIDLEFQDAVRACDTGLIEAIDASKLLPAPDGTPAAEDYYEGSLMECGAGTIMWSNIIAYDKNRFSDDPPDSIADFFDLERYPGQRGMKNTPNGALEMALMADGVPAAEVYDALATPEAMARAFAKLDSIKDSITFWGTHAQAPQLLADGEVAMTVAANGRIYNAITEEGQPFGIIWDGQIWNVDVWAVSAVSENKQAAMEFVRFATQPERLAAQTKWIAYGPVRKSSQQFVAEDVRPHLPSYPANFENSVPNGFEFWAANQDTINERWSAWLLK